MAVEDAKGGLGAGASKVLWSNQYPLSRTTCSAPSSSDTKKRTPIQRQTKRPKLEQAMTSVVAKLSTRACGCTVRRASDHGA